MAPTIATTPSTTSQFDTTTTSYAPPTLDASSNYGLSLSLENWSDNGNNADGFDFSSGVTNTTDLLFRTTGTAGGAPDLGLSSVTFPAGTIHPGDWIKLPVTGGNSGGNAIGKSGRVVVPIQYQAVLATAKTWGAAGNIVIGQGNLGEGGSIGGDTFGGGEDDGPTAQVPGSVTPGTYWVRNQNRFNGRGCRQHRQHRRIFRHPDHHQRQRHHRDDASGGPERHHRTKPVRLPGQLCRIQRHCAIYRGCKLGRRLSLTPSSAVASDGSIPDTNHTFAAAGNDTVTVTVNDWGGEASTNSSTFHVAARGIAAGTLVIAWANPADIVYGTVLGGSQLDASSTVSGTFAYSPLAGTVLNAGQKPNPLGDIYARRHG